MATTARSVHPLILARWLAGPLVWTAHFLVVYASESLICTRGGGGGVHLALIAAATVIGLGVIMAATMQNWRRAAEAGKAGAAFMDRLGAMLGLLGMLGLLWAALPAAMLGSCTLPG